MAAMPVGLQRGAGAHRWADRSRSPVRVAVAWALTLLLAAAATGCGARSSPSHPGTNATLTYVDTTSFMLDWDPATSYSNELVAMSNMYERLVRYDTAARAVEPELATSWRQSDRGRRWVFHLRRGVRFHTGRELDAH